MDFIYEIQYLQAAVGELEAYLLADDLFWPINSSPPAGGQPFPRLTIGGLLLAQRRAEATADSQEEQWKVEKVNQRIQVSSQKWRLRWEEKSRRELLSRLMQWRNYLQEYRQDPERNAAFYAYEVRWRVMVELLENEVDALTKNENELRSGLDSILRAVFVPGDFLWEDVLRSSFPDSIFWYLYGQPRSRRRP